MSDKKSILVSETTHNKLKLYCERKGQKIGFGATFILNNYLDSLGEITTNQNNISEDLTEKCIMINFSTHAVLKTHCNDNGKKMGVVVDYILNMHIDKNKYKAK